MEEPIREEPEQARVWELTLGKTISSIVFFACVADFVLVANTWYPTMHEYYGLDISGLDTIYVGALAVLTATYVALGPNPKK